MRLIHLSIFILILVSCGTNKIRLKAVDQVNSKTNTTGRKIIPEEIHENYNSILISEEKLQTNETEEKEELFLPDEILETNSEFVPEKGNPKVDQIDPEILLEASKSTKIAKRSLVLNSIGLISVIMPTLGIFFILTGAISYFRASSFRYITEAGERNRKLSGQILLIDTAIILLWITLILVIVLL